MDEMLYALGQNIQSVDIAGLILFAAITEEKPTSRFWFGSPCRFVRALDLVIHVIIPEFINDSHPMMAAFLRSTSPRWGRAWRSW